MGRPIAPWVGGNETPAGCFVSYDGLGVRTTPCPLLPAPGPTRAPSSAGPRSCCPQGPRGPQGRAGVALEAWVSARGLCWQRRGCPQCLCLTLGLSVSPQTLLSAKHIVIATGGRPRYPTEVSAPEHSLACRLHVHGLWARVMCCLLCSRSPAHRLPLL